MDFEIGNILYVVITIVAIIIGLLGKKKKPAKAVSGAAEETGGSGFMDNLGKVFNMGDEEQVFQNAPVYEEAPVKEEVLTEGLRVTESSDYMADSVNSYDPELEANVDMILADADLMNSDSLSVIDIDEVGEGTDYFEVIQNFDAGTAVVYSAIINRFEY